MKSKIRNNANTAAQVYPNEYDSYQKQGNSQQIGQKLRREQTEAYYNG